MQMLAKRSLLLLQAVGKVPALFIKGRNERQIRHSSARKVDTVK